MRRNQRQAHDLLCRDLVLHTAERLDRLRTMVERSGLHNREELERTLDTLRGLRNRVMARVEAAHLATDDAWPFARATADQAIEELMGGLDAVEKRLKRAAA